MPPPDLRRARAGFVHRERGISGPGPFTRAIHVGEAPPAGVQHYPAGGDAFETPRGRQAARLGLVQLRRPMTVPIWRALAVRFRSGLSGHS